MPSKIRRCARCDKKLKVWEIYANWNDEWFACEPCWDVSDGFLGWPSEILADAMLKLEVKDEHKAMPRP